MRKPFALLLSLSAISACGGSGGSSGQDTISVADELVTLGTNPAQLTATFDYDTNTVTVLVGATDTEYLYDTDGLTLTNGTLTVYSRLEPNDLNGFGFAIYGETSTGSGAVTLVNSNDTGIVTLVADIERIGTTEIPTAGRIEYVGSYIGQFNILEDSAWSLTGDVGITGDVMLTANFSNASTISGAVTNRSSGGASVADINLELSAVSNGGFTGAASGGEYGFSSSSVNGTYAGLLTGPDATEVIGGILIEHPQDIGGLSPFVLTEVGVFTAEKDAP